MTSAVAVRLLEREAPTSTSGGSMSLTEFDLGDEKVKITFTAGIADKSDLDNEFTSDSEHGIARMISFADKRLYYGKNTGRDKISIRNE